MVALVLTVAVACTQRPTVRTQTYASREAKGLDVNPGAFGENIATENVDIIGLAVGDKLAIGEARLEITQKGKECLNPCAICEQVGDCVMPREGIFARVLKGGTVRVGDAVERLP